jgi:hypothetical protein
VSLGLVVIGLVELRQYLLFFLSHFMSEERVVWLDGAECVFQQPSRTVVDRAVGFDVMALGDRGRAVAEEGRGGVRARPARDDRCAGTSAA